MIYVTRGVENEKYTRKGLAWLDFDHSYVLKYIVMPLL